MAARKDDRVLEFAVPVNIAANLPRIHQMCHFLIVNTTQRSVDKAVEQQIVTRLTESLDVEEIPSLPKWILNVVERGEVKKAVKIVEFLNETPDSPWHGRVKMANQDRGSMNQGSFVNQRSFVKAITKYVLTANNPISALDDFDKEKKILLNYWKAISGILDDGSASVLYRYNGVELFCQFSIPFFTKLQENRSFTVDTMKNLLRDCFENIGGEHAGVGHAQWWVSGGKASGLNTAAVRIVAREMSKALHKPAMSSELEL